MRILIFILFLFILGSCTNNEYEKRCNANIEIASRYFTEIYNQDKIHLIDELFVEDYSHRNTSGVTFNGTDNLKTAIKRVKSILPNLKVEITEVSADKEKVIFLITMNSDLPKMANPETKANKISFTETFIFWVKDNKIYKGRTSGAHLPMIKQISGFEGTIQEIIKILSQEKGSGEIEL